MSSADEVKAADMQAAQRLIDNVAHLRFVENEDGSFPYDGKTLAEVVKLIEREFPGATTQALLRTERYGAERATNEWQPIETAPRDGTHVIVCRYTWKWARSGAFSAGGWWTNGDRLNGEPDLWMPLPEPPDSE